MACCALIHNTFVPVFVCLFVGIKPQKLYSASCVGREVNPLGVVTHGQRHKPRAYQRQRHIPRTCQSMLNTLQVDGLARIPGLTLDPYKTHPQPPNGVSPCLVWRIGFGRREKLKIWWIEIANCPPTQLSKTNQRKITKWPRPRKRTGFGGVVNMSSLYF